MDVEDRERNSMDSIPYRTLQHKGFLPRIELSSVASRSETTWLRKVGNPDWAVLEIGEPELFLPNLIQLPDEKSPTFIEAIVPRDEIRPGLVWIAAGSGLHKGVLSETPASIFLWGAFCEIRQISLNRSLCELSLLASYQ